MLGIIAAVAGAVLWLMGTEGQENIRSVVWRFIRSPRFYVPLIFLLGLLLGWGFLPHTITSVEVTSEVTRVVEVHMEVVVTREIVIEADASSLPTQTSVTSPATLMPTLEPTVTVDPLEPVMYRCSNDPPTPLHTISSPSAEYTNVSLGKEQEHDYGFRLRAFDSAQFTTSAEINLRISIYDAQSCNLLQYEDVYTTLDNGQGELKFKPNFDGEFFVRIIGRPNTFSDAIGNYTLTYQP